MATLQDQVQHMLTRAREQDPCVVAANEREADDYGCLAHLRAEQVLPLGSTIENAHEHFFIDCEGSCDNCSVAGTCPIVVKHCDPDEEEEEYL